MLKKTLLILATMGMMIPSFAFAQYGLDTASQGTGLIKGGQTINARTEVPELIGTIVGVILSFVGAIFFLLILYAGFLWMTAFGAADKVDKAKSILEHAAVGLLIVLAAYAISRFVFSSLVSGGGGSQTANEITFTVCETTYPGEGYCTLRNNCQALIDSGTRPGTNIVTNLCPGGADNICCVIPGGAGGGT